MEKGESGLGRSPAFGISPPLFPYRKAGNSAFFNLTLLAFKLTTEETTPESLFGIKMSFTFFSFVFSHFVKFTSMCECYNFSLSYNSFYFF